MKNVAVIGAGTMGNGIAHTFAQNDYKVQFSTKTIDKIALLYERDIVEFNYDFE